MLVLFKTVGNSCWVSDNHYDMYEIPLKGKEFQFEGKYYFLAHNTDFDYWVFGLMEYTIDTARTKLIKSLVDKAEFLPYGTYDIIVNGKQRAIKKKTTGNNTNYGLYRQNTLFDNLGSRKKAYNTTSSKIVGKICGIKQNITSLKGGDAVKIYKNKNKK